jgi:uncharacterized protein with HEPN domain
MDNKVKAKLTDIVKAIDEIKLFIKDIKGFSDYKDDLKSKRAVERNVAIIGEAVNQLSKIDETVLITNAKRIVATRNRIIHSYDNVSDDIIWAIIVKELSELEKEIEWLLKNA